MRRRSLSNLTRCLACIVALAALAGMMQASTHLAKAASARAKAIQLEHRHSGTFTATPDARRVADWAVRTGDNERLPFIIIDKVAAAIFVFDVQGRIRAAAPALLGTAKGDRFAPGSDKKNMYHTLPQERITPAGRFQAERGIGEKGEDVVWIHYDSGIALHEVLDNPGERRRERLASATPKDNRVSYGCVNVPTDFYRHVVRPIFEKADGIVYVLPETQPAMELFRALSKPKPRLGGTAPGSTPQTRGG